MTEKEAINVLNMVEAHDPLSKKAKNIAIKALKEVLEYREIGTVEECQEAKDKQKTRKPAIGADFMIGKDDNGEPIWEHDYVCPECGSGIAEEFVCCPYCGTYIDWSEDKRM